MSINRYDITDWTVTGYWPYTAMFGGMPVTKTIPARVPGSIYMDLMNAKIIEDPYYGANSIKCEWVANRWWVYQANFNFAARNSGRRFRLVLRGIDYKAHISVNGTLLGVHEGMYVPFAADVTPVLREGANEIKVVLESAPDEMGQIGYTSRTWTQKARFTYKWDFSTRLVGMGLYDDVYIEEIGNAALDDVHIRYLDGQLHIAAAGQFGAELFFDGNPVANGKGNDKIILNIPCPRLWYPNGSGGQPLYRLNLKLYEDGALSDEKNYTVGLRTLSYERCNGADETALPYIPCVNGKRVYIKGVNMTPLDCMYGCVDDTRYEKFVRLAAEANVNLIRVWGGGLIEKEAFYELCDRYGIMVWQEFIQSSSGIDNIPSKRPEFLALMCQTAEFAVREKRNHVSLTFWSGGNELMDQNGIPSTYEDENIALLLEITKRLDSDRLMLPTSASGPSEWLDLSRPHVNHDIHGDWKYGGPERHYYIYNHSNCMLHSEFGCDGMSNLSSIVKAIPPEDLHVDTVHDNLMWRHHGEWWDTLVYRDKPIFGEFERDDLEGFIRVSQFMQAEAIRYAVEANRRRQWENCGSIVWQFNEPWRNISCTCLVDYDGNPKPAYYWFANALKGEHISLRYEKLLWKRGEVFSGSLFVHSDSGKHTLRDAGAKILDTAGNMLANVTGDFAWTVDTPCTGFVIECTLGNDDINRYTFFITDEEHPFADRTII